MSVKVQALDHLVINVADVVRTVEWYRKVLGMEVRVFDPGGGKAPRMGTRGELIAGHHSGAARHHRTLNSRIDQNDPSATGRNACTSCWSSLPPMPSSIVKAREWVKGMR